MNLKPIDDIFESRRVTDENGKSHELRSEISKAEGEFIYSLILNNDIERSIEIGCAFGISFLYICNALSQKKHNTMLLLIPISRPSGTV